MSTVTKEQVSNQKYNAKMARSERKVVVAEREESIRNVGAVTDEAIPNLVDELSTAKKPKRGKGLELTDQQAELDRLLKAGIAKPLRVSLKALNIQQSATQCRVAIDPEWMKRLSDRIAESEDVDLDRIVVFEDPATFELRVGDGHHRAMAYEKAGRDDIPAYVIPGGFDEAVKFSTTATARGSLPRDKDSDIKAIEMLFAIPECWVWADTRIADHCLVPYSLVRNTRRRLAVRLGVDLPDKVVGHTGVWRTYNNHSWRKPGIRAHKAGGGTAFRVNIGYQQYHLGYHPDQSHGKLLAIVDNLERRKQSLELGVLRTSLAAQLLLFEYFLPKKAKLYRGLSGLHGYGVVFCTTTFKEIDAVQAAQGRLRQLRLLLGVQDIRMVCVCYPEDGPQAVMDLARQDGIEFLTPEELVASIKGSSE